MDWLNRNHVKMKLFEEEEVSRGADERRKDLAERVREVVRKDLGLEGEANMDQEYLLAVVDALKVSLSLSAGKAS